MKIRYSLLCAVLVTGFIALVFFAIKPHESHTRLKADNSSAVPTLRESSQKVQQIATENSIEATAPTTNSEPFLDPKIQMQKIKAAAIRDRDIAIDPATFRNGTPPQIVDWSQFIPTGENLQAQSSKVEMFAITGLKSYAFDYSNAIAAEGYHEVTEKDYPDIVESLRKPENQAKLLTIQKQSGDENGLNGLPFIILTREAPRPKASKS